MAINLTRGDTRPFLIGVAVLTLLGWGLYLDAELDKADNQHGAGCVILALSVIQDGLKTQLADQEQAAGSIADLQAKIQDHCGQYAIKRSDTGARSSSGAACLGPEGA